MPAALLFYKISQCKQNTSISGVIAFAASHLGLYVCLCPKKRMPGLYTVS